MKERNETKVIHLDNLHAYQEAAKWFGFNLRIEKIGGQPLCFYINDPLQKRKAMGMAVPDGHVEISIQKPEGNRRSFKSFWQTLVSLQQMSEEKKIGDNSSNNYFKPRKPQ